MRKLRRGAESPCNCVFRGIFRACYAHFREYDIQGAQCGSVSLEQGRGPTGYRLFSRKREEFMADFCLIAQRELTEEEYRVFRYFFLLRADSRLCSRYIGLDRGSWYHAIYRIEMKLGRRFAEMKPYPLYPIDEYMGGAVRTTRIQPSRQPLRIGRRRRIPDERLPMTA
jgi:hypothetical protein